MAASRIFLAAKHRNAEISTAFEQTGYAAPESVRRCDTIVQDPTFGIVVLGFRRSTAQLIAHVEVSNATGLQIGTKRLPVKVGNIFGIWMRTGVDEDANRMLRQQANELLNWVIGVTNREDFSGRTLSTIFNCHRLTQQRRSSLHHLNTDPLSSVEAMLITPGLIRSVRRPGHPASRS